MSDRRAGPLRVLALGLALWVMPAQGQTPAQVQPPAPAADDAYGAYQRGYFITAIREAVARIDRNPSDGAAMTLLGVIYGQGVGVATDLPGAATWFRRAHERGDLNGTFGYAMALLRGQGVDRNVELGRQLLEQAAERGHGEAAYNVALLLLAGDDFNGLVRAAGLLRRAANQEIPDAQYALAVLHRDGRGVAVNLAEARGLLERAAANNHLDSIVDLAIMVFNGDGGPADEARAANLFRRAAWRGSVIAQNRYARLLVAGRGVLPDRVEAASWHMLASGKGLADGWLDAQLDGLTAEEREAADALIRRRQGPGE